MFGWGDGSICHSPVGFPKFCFLETGWSPVLCDFLQYYPHILPENFIENPQFVQKIWRFYFLILFKNKLMESIIDDVSIFLLSTYSKQVVLGE